LSWILSFKKSFCVHNCLGKTFVNKVKPTKLQIMLKLSTSVRHNKIMLKWSTMSNTRWSCSSDQNNVKLKRSTCSFTALQSLTNKPDCCPRDC
jgi:hypothetical protein